jgi:hypothetical protein
VCAGRIISVVVMLVPSRPCACGAERWRIVGRDAVVVSSLRVAGQRRSCSTTKPSSIRQSLRMQGEVGGLDAAGGAGGGVPACAGWKSWRRSPNAAPPSHPCRCGVDGCPSARYSARRSHPCACRAKSAVSTPLVVRGEPSRHCAGRRPVRSCTIPWARVIPTGAGLRSTLHPATPGSGSHPCLCGAELKFDSPIVDTNESSRHAAGHRHSCSTVRRSSRSHPCACGADTY